MRKIASHFWLRPDGTLGRFPVITFDDNNVIIGIREREEFMEEASLELVNGILIPGLVNIITELDFNQGESSIKRMINRFVIQGVKVIGTTSQNYELIRNTNTSKISVFILNAQDVINDDLIGFERIQEASNSLDELINLTIKNAIAIGAQEKYGSLEVGKSPGLLAISNVDHKPLNIHRLSKLKIIL